MFDYRYGFNGKEKDQNGEFGSITNYDYGFRIYNPAAGRFLSVDPLTGNFPQMTPYQFASNGPIWGIDVEGLEVDIIIQSPVKTRVAIDNTNAAQIESTVAIAQYSYLNQPWPNTSDYDNLVKDATRLHKVDGTTDPYPSISNSIAISTPNGTESTIRLFGTIWKDGKWGGELEQIYLGEITVPKGPKPKPSSGPPGFIKPIAEPIQELGDIAQDIGNNPGIVAAEVGLQFSVRNVTFGGSHIFASEGNTGAINYGGDSGGSSSVSFGVSFYLAKDRSTSLILSDIAGGTNSATLSLPPPYRFNFDASIYSSEKYNGIGAGVSPLSPPGVSTSGTETIIKEQKDENEPKGNN